MPSSRRESVKSDCITSSWIPHTPPCKNKRNIVKCAVTMECSWQLSPKCRPAWYTQSLATGKCACISRIEAPAESLRWGRVGWCWTEGWQRKFLPSCEAVKKKNLKWRRANWICTYLAAAANPPDPQPDGARREPLTRRTSECVLIEAIKTRLLKDKQSSFAFKWAAIFSNGADGRRLHLCFVKCRRTVCRGEETVQIKLMISSTACWKKK